MTTFKEPKTATSPDAVSLSGYLIDPLYEPKGGQTDPTIGRPGTFPYTRGVHETMYRSRLWTMRQFAGFGSADDTNARFMYLLENAKGTKANTGWSQRSGHRLSNAGFQDTRDVIHVASHPCA